MEKFWKLFNNKSSEVFHCRRNIDLVIADHVDIPPGSGIFYPYFFYVQMVQQIHFRHNGNSEIFCRQAGDNLVFLRLVGDPGPFSDFFKETVNIIAYPGTGGKIYIGIGKGLFQICFLVSGQGMVLGNNEY